ncbi:MAG TPA: hypothetical protein VGY32_14455 [Solirubrobacteraceae bacterium]|nr:hypothetical protein [Solirubrobacteraceae bacterium]
MRELQTPTGSQSADREMKITEAASGAYGMLLAALGRGVTTHPFRDGGLICEDRTRSARPTLWRISPEGAVLPDSQYSFAHRSFITSALPPGL